MSVVVGVGVVVGCKGGGVSFQLLAGCVGLSMSTFYQSECVAKVMVEGRRVSSGDSGTLRVTDAIEGKRYVT